MRPDKIRTTSWALAALAFALPASIYFYQQNQFEKAVEESQRFICGMPLLAIWFFSLFLSLLLSLVAFAFSITSYRDLYKPRPAIRKVELVAMLLPLPIFFLIGIIQNAVSRLLA